MPNVPNFLKPFKKADDSKITTRYSEIHKATDWWEKYGLPLVAPEDGEVIRILGNEFTPDDTHPLARGYVLDMLGESGFRHEYWHILPFLPVKVGDKVKRGEIVCYMGNSGNVLAGGSYVPVVDRTKEPFLGTHLHQNAIENGIYLDPTIYMNFNEEPQYGILDELSAMGKTLASMAKSLI